MRRLLLALALVLWCGSADAAIQYVGGQASTFVGTTTTTTITFSLTGGLASVPAGGDLVIVCFSVGSTADAVLDIETTGAVDYTTIGAELYQGTDTFDSNFECAYRFMPGTPETQFRFAGGSGNAANAACWSVHVYRGVDTGTPLDVAAVTVGGINTRLANAGSITPVTTGAWIQIAGAGAGGTGGTYTTSGLTDFRANTAVDTNDCLLGTGYKSDWVSGAYDHAVFGGGGTDTTNDSWNAIATVLRPSTAVACTGSIALLGVGCR